MQLPRSTYFTSEIQHPSLSVILKMHQKAPT